MDEATRRIARRGKKAAIVAAACALVPLLTGCGPALAGFGAISTVYFGAIITTPLRSYVGAVIRQIIVGG